MNIPKSHPTRVSPSNLCPICNSDSWCLAGDVWIVCMRVESERPKQLSSGETGWLHPVGSKASPRPVRAENPAPLLNTNLLMDVWRKDRRGHRLEELSASIGVTVRSLQMLECVRAPYHNTWAFPMRSGDGSYTGIRLRNLKGEKWAERGSHQGLFIPQTEPQRTVLLVEGPTDCAAALTIGYYAIGRPNCCGGIDHLQKAVKHYNLQRAVIVSDLDDPGLRGAKTLAEHLPVPSAILVCPCKDLRQAIRSGMDRTMLDAMINQLVWRQVWT